MLEAIVQRGTLISIGALIICVFGVIAALRVPVQMIPDLEVRVISVRTDWPGVTPQDIEKEIIIEQEEYLRNIPNLERMTSLAFTGAARIELEFPFGVDINDALIRVNNALSQVPAYPENVDEPRLYTTSFSSNAFMYFRVEPLPGNPRNVDMDMMLDFIEDNVRTPMERVPGVSQVEVRGGANRQIQIYIDPTRLAARGISLTRLRGIIRDRNRDVSAGDVDSGKRRYLLRTVGRFDDLQQLANLIINREGDAITRLKDVANIKLGHFEVSAISSINGKPVIFVAVRREIGSNVVAIKEALIPVTERISRDVLEPVGMHMELTTDDVRYVKASIKNVWKNLSIGAVLATLVMYLFLRSPSAVLVGVLGIPICTITAFLGLLIAGRTINVISLAGVAFAIGMTLDNTIVVLESIERERRKGLNRLRASVAGVKQVWSAVLASTLTTILVFAPVLLVKQEAGQLYSDIAVAISASILISMVVAFTVIPAASSRMSFGDTRVQHRIGGSVKKAIIDSLGWLIHGPIRRLTCIVCIVVLTVWVIMNLTPPAEYLPEGEEYKSFSTMIAPPGYSLPEMQKIAKQLNAEFLPYLNDDPKNFSRGESQVPALAYLVLWAQPQQIRMIAETIDPSHINSLMDIIDEKFKEYPGMRAFSSRGSIISSNDGGTRSVNVDVSGADLETIYKTAYAAYQRAEAIFDKPRIGSAPASLILGQPLIELRPYWDYAAELGISATDIGFAVSALTDGAYVDEFFMADDKIDIFLYNAAGKIEQIGDIKNIPIFTSQGASVPIGAVAELVETVDTETIRRVDGDRTVTLNIIPPRSVALETAITKVREELIYDLRDSGEIPAGVTLDISGASDQLDATRAALLGNFLIAVLLCYLLLVAIFSHWGYPLIIMINVPLGIAGGIIGLWLLNLVGGELPRLGLLPIQQPFDMITMLGFLILVGTVVNNPILLIDRALTNLREAKMSPAEAVISAVELRLRPIMMSTITTVCGLAPLVFIPGAGTELYRGVGAIVLFGLFFATVVTLVFLPTLLVTVFNWQEQLFAKKE